MMSAQINKSFCETQRLLLRMFVVFAIVITLAVPSDVSSSDPRMPEEQRKFSAGVFQIVVPKPFTILTGKKLDELRHAILGGIKTLNDKSNLGAVDENLDNLLLSFSVIKSVSEDWWVVFYEMQTADPITLVDFVARQKELFKWGIDTGRLSKDTKSPQIMVIDNRKCVYMEIKLAGGICQQSYTFSPVERPGIMATVDYLCFDPDACRQSEKDISTMVASLKVVIRTP